MSAREDERLHMLLDVLAEAQRRSAAGDGVWQRLDWQRVAVAGFDLGAYTAMIMAGEHVPGVQPPTGTSRSAPLWR